eukprot:GHVU01047146.1.p1 GENE.GHVU01047146.1~~GHVU01047146.1.p1  ORF type:complete len:110 (+),score=1.54 GHVU01047146.1:1751-2080(+)
MLGLPLFVEHPFNAAWIVHNGYGLSLDGDTFSSVQLTDTINTLLSDPKYRNKIAKASIILRSQRHPQKKAGYWINHVFKFGSYHLHSHGVELPWYEYMMLDVLACVYQL